MHGSDNTAGIFLIYNSKINFLTRDSLHLSAIASPKLPVFRIEPQDSVVAMAGLAVHRYTTVHSKQVGLVYYEPPAAKIDPNNFWANYSLNLENTRQLS